MSEVDGLFFWMKLSALFGACWMGALWVRLAVTAAVERQRQY